MQEKHPRNLFSFFLSKKKNLWMLSFAFLNVLFFLGTLFLFKNHEQKMKDNFWSLMDSMENSHSKRPLLKNSLRLKNPNQNPSFFMLSQFSNTRGRQQHLNQEHFGSYRGTTVSLNSCASSSERNTIEIFSQTAPLVAFIHSIKFKINFFSFFNDEPSIQKGEGSGILWKDQYIVTNYHVIEGAHEIYVTLRGSQTHPAKVLGIEPKKDLAVLGIKAPKTSKITFAHRTADSSKVLVGQKALAIGNPFGLDYTLTVGVISALGRSIPALEGGITIRDVLQTDASINPGNSGGPLIDSCGRLLGINTAIFSRKGNASSDIGFAIPSHTVKRVVNQIIKYGKVKQPGIGIIPFRGIMRSYLKVSGLVIRSIVSGSPADKANLEGLSYRQNRLFIGDVIVKIDDTNIKDFDDFYNELDKKSLGQVVLFTVLKGGQQNRKTLLRIPLVDVSNYSDY